MNKFNYQWSLKDYPESNNYKVFSCFACGGGSTMGYKLAGYHVLGCNDIDDKMMTVYKANHHPQFSYLEDIRTFKLRDDLPSALYNLDILDGSPPCTTFSMAGDREDSWGKKKKFAEGQAEQTLDDLSFEFVTLINKLQPKIFVMENVSGLMIGNAQKYVETIYKQCNLAGYKCLGVLLNSKYMGVPQSRERFFILGMQDELTKLFNNHYDMFSGMPYIPLTFNNPLIPFSQIRENDAPEHKLSPQLSKYWALTPEGNSMSVVHPKGSYFNEIKVSRYLPLPTIRASGRAYDYAIERPLTDKEIILGSSFPTDYEFNNNKVHYVCGMSVPPVMMATIADAIKTYWLDIIYSQSVMQLEIPKEDVKTETML